MRFFHELSDTELATLSSISYFLQIESDLWTPHLPGRTDILKKIIYIHVSLEMIIWQTFLEAKKELVHDPLVT